MIAQILVVYGSFTTGTKTFFSGGQFRPDRGGQFGPDRGGQFGAVGGGQFKPDRGGQLHRIFHITNEFENPANHDSYGSWRFETEENYNNPAGGSNECCTIVEAYYNQTDPSGGRDDFNFFAIRLGDVTGNCTECYTFKNDPVISRSSSDTLPLLIGTPTYDVGLSKYKTPVYMGMTSNLGMLALSIEETDSALVSVESSGLVLEDATGDYIVKNSGSILNLIWVNDTSEYVSILNNTLLFYIVTDDSTYHYRLSTDFENSWYPNTSDRSPIKLVRQGGGSLNLKRGNFVYPNPGSEKVFVSLEDMEGLPTRVEIRTLTGNIVDQRDKVVSGSLILPVGYLKPDLYIISKQSDKKFVSQKWLKL